MEIEQTQPYGPPDPHSREGEFIWFQDLKSSAASAVLAAAEVRTYGDLALYSEDKLLELGLIREDLMGIKSQLSKRDMQLAEEADSQ